MNPEFPVRLQVYLAKCGVGSRRHCERLIAEGHVKVNSVTVSELGSKVEETDLVTVDEIAVEPYSDLFYFALNKPKGYVCTNYDPFEQKYARDLIDIDAKYQLFNVGRLDKDSQGLIFFTNDGLWANRIMHPSGQTEKEYSVTTNRSIRKKDLDDIYRGKITPYKIRSFSLVSGKKVRLVLTEGKNREIRNIFSELGYKVTELVRIRIGSVWLEDLPPGKYRKLTAAEIRSFDGGNK